MVKKIAIIGGGISGLALLHFLNKRFGRAIEVTLYERNASLGGNIRSLSEDGFCFETGPNGFLNNQPDTLELISDLGLQHQLIEARPGKRYVQINDRLSEVPTGLSSLITSPLLSIADKIALVKGFLNKKTPLDQSVYNYAVMRFGKNIALKLVDPFVSGIVAGDIHRLHTDSAFGKMLNKVKDKSAPKLATYSFKNGMGDLITGLSDKYHAQIKLGAGVSSLESIHADHIFCTCPAYSAAALLMKEHQVLAQLLERIVYVPVAVIGLAFEQGSFRHQPDGFGYLIPSSQKKEILGVLFESNVFEGRAPHGRLMVRVMMGGRHHPSIVNEDPMILVERAQKELDKIYGLKTNCVDHWTKVWGFAIPQYEMEYPTLVKQIREQEAKIPQLTLSGNYLGGISFNDCVNNAKSIAQSIRL